MKNKPHIMTSVMFGQIQNNNIKHTKNIKEYNTINNNMKNTKKIKNTIKNTKKYK